MTLRPRPTRAPRPVTACWAVSVLGGAVLIIVGTHPARPEPQTLSPSSVTDYLRRIAGPTPSDIRVNGLYGSGHHGAWQFVAHLTWHTPTGAITGGTATLPQLAGQPALDSPFSADRLTSEERLGWTLNTLDTVLDTVPHPDDTLALIDLEIPNPGPASLIACHAGVLAHGHCETRDHAGHRIGSSVEALLDESLFDALSVQRASAPITP